MGSRERRYSGWLTLLSWAGAVFLVLWDCTPAQNYVYSFVDSKGIRHIKNIPLEMPSGQDRDRGQRPQAMADSASDDIPKSPPAKISLNRDHRGVLHIASVRSPQPVAVDQTVALRAAPKAGGRKMPGIRPVAVAGQEVLPAAAVAEEFHSLEQLNPEGIDEGVSQMSLFIDQNGKMYIYRANVEARQASDLEALTQAAKTGPDLKIAPAIAEQSTPAIVPAALLHQPQSQKLSAREAKQVRIWPSGTIRVFRDKKGFTHIVNNNAGMNSRLAVPKRSKPVMTAICSQSLPAPPEHLAVMPQTPEGLNPSYSRIVSFLDKGGRLNIANPKGKGLPDIGQAAQSPQRNGENRDLEAIMSMAAQQYRLPLALVKAVVRAESGFMPEAVSWKGAMGLMQLMPGTAAWLGVRDPFCPQENIMGGCRYLRDLLNRLNGSVPLSLAAYNAGLQRVINSGYQIPAITETQDFVDKVIGYFFNYLHGPSSGRKI